MRHKMRLVWMLMTLTTVGVTLTDGTLESWGFSQLLSLLGHGDHGLESEARSLSRHRRDVSTGSEYILDVEISIPDPSLAIQIKQYLTNNLSYPLPLGSGDTNITSIKVTTACNQTGSEVQCSCESGYTWATDVCTAYTQCPGYSNCSCIKSNTFPSQFCQPQTVNTKLSLTMQKVFTSDLYDPTSSTFKEYKGALENQFNKSYQSLPGFKSATVTGFRPGSVIADYTVVSEATTPEALSTANSALISDLANTTYAATSVNSIVTGWSTLTVDPATSYLNDSVTLSCTVNVTSYSAVSWYFNGTQKIANDSNWSFATGSVTGGIQSYLTIKKASFIYSGTYQCNIDLNSYTYTASTTLQVQSMELSPMTSVVTCDGTKVPIIQCCTKEGTVTFNLTCQKTSGNIIGITESSALCQAYNIIADSQSCSSAQSSTFGCTCTTNKGAILQQDVTVAYQTSYQVNVTASSDQISEWTDLTLTCKCNVPNVQSITWNFINNNNVSSAITNTYSSSNLNTCTSTLTIPAASTSVNWNGTFSCVVNAAYTGNKGIVIYRLAKSSEITISPITKGFVLGTPIDFSCCLDTATAYRPDKTVLEISCNPGSNIPSQPMTLSGSCFTTSYTIPSVTNCASFVAACNITNLIGSTVKSNQMVLNVIQNPQCTGLPQDINLNIGVGEAGKNYTVSCSQIDPNLEGNRIYNCDGATKQWVKVSDNCVSKVLNNINNQATILGSSPNPNVLVPNVVSQLNETVSQNKNLTASVANIELVVNILQQVGSAATSVQPNVMQDFLNTVSIVVDSSTTSTWNQTQNKVNQSSNLLESVERFAKSLIITDSSVSIIKPNVQLKGEIASNLTTSYNAMFDFSQSNKLTGNVTINKNILDQMPKDTRVVSIAYATLKDIIGVPSNTSTNKTVNGLVMTTVLSNKSTISIAMDFKISDTNLTNASCVWWNPITQDWDGTGCYLGTQSTNDTINCVCNHLTSFSILMSTSELSPEAKIILSYITYIGVGISMLSLVICIIIETMVWKSVTKNKTSYLRHVCIMNIAVTLLMADIWFIVGAALNPTDNTQACVAATFFAHLFYLCVFFWMLTMGLILFYRLMCVFHDLSKTTMMGISFFLGYGCPIIITVVTVAATQSRNIYLMPTDCWLNMVESKAFLAFVIPAFTILLVNFITLLVVIVKVLRPSVGDKPKKEEKSTLNHITKCILILTPLLGLTWGFGIGTMVTDTVAIHGIFAALNSLQGFFILLFGCLMDKKVRDALFSRFTISRWSSQQTKTSNLSSSDPVFAKKGINLFGKKGVYNINSAQANSSSDMASSNSYSLLT